VQPAMRVWHGPDRRACAEPGPRGLDDTVLVKHERIAVSLFVVSGFNPQQGSHLHSVLRT